MIRKGVDRGQSVLGRERYDQVATNGCSGPRNYQAATRRTRECADGVLDFTRVAQSIGLTSTPSDGATAWMAPNCATPVTAAR